MSTPATTLGSLPVTSARSAVRLLSRAFADDPILNHYFDDEVRRAAAMRAFFGDVVFGCRRAGCIDTARRGGRTIAIAVWLPPNWGPPNRAEERHARAAEKRITALFPAAKGLFEGFGRLQERHPEERHWYLCFVGVDPRFQRCGIGTALLEPTLRRADETRTLCYLETPFPETHRFYRSLGFEITGQMRPFDGAPPLWTLARPPK